MEFVALSLGTNVDDRRAHMQRMVERVSALLLPPVRISDLVETEPIGPGKYSAWFYNRVIAGEYNGTPEQLLAACHEIERELGRVRGPEKTDRSADIDILLFGNIAGTAVHLNVPHPSILERRFLLDGLYQIAPEMLHPVTLQTFKYLYCTMDEKIRRQGLRTIFSSE